MNLRKSHFFDTNICIYMKELYASPKSFNLNDPYLTQSLVKLISYLNENRFIISPSLGADEYSRDLGTFLPNKEKLAQTLNFIEALFSMTDEELQSYIISDAKHDLIKGSNQLFDSKITAIQQDSLFRNNFLPLFYLAFMKLYLIVQDNGSCRVNAFNEFLKFLKDDLNLINSTLLQLAVYYIGNEDGKIPFISKLKKARRIDKLLHTFFNSSIDLSLPMLVSYIANQNDFVPIYVTADKDLANYLLSVTKIRVKLHINDSYSPMTQVVFDNTLFTDEEIRAIRSNLCNITGQRAAEGAEKKVFLKKKFLSYVVTLNRK